MSDVPFNYWGSIFTQVFNMLVSNFIGVFWFGSIVIILVVSFILRLSSHKK